MAEEKKKFLMDHRDEIIQKIRNPIQLADVLQAKGLIDNELFSTIKSSETKQDKTREIFGCTNSTVHFVCFYDWLKEKESDMFEELENRDPEGPQRKRARLKNMDETDNNIAKPPDLTMIYTFPKLEDWVSVPNISQNLLCDLERKLTDKSMEDLKKELKDKEPKNSLCFNADDIDEIRKNKELDTFLNTTKDAKFPKIPLKMFFKKCGKAQSSTDHEEIMDTSESLGSSGYGSLLRSNLNDNNCPLNFDCLGQNNKALPGEDVCTECSPNGDMDMKIHDNKDNELESKTTEQQHGGSVIQMHHEVKADATSQEPMASQDIHIDKMDQQSRRSDVSKHKDVSLQENAQFRKKETQLVDGIGGTDMQDINRETDEEPQRSFGSSDSRYEDVSLQENERFTKKESLLENGLGAADMQDTHIREPDEEPQRSGGPNDSRYEDVSLQENERFSKKETPLEDGLGGTDMQDIKIRETDEEPQRSCGRNDSRYEDVSLHQNERFTKKESPLEDELGGTDMQDINIRETDEEPQRSCGPNYTKHEDTYVRQNESDRCRNMNIHQNVQGNMEVDPEPFSSKQLQEYTQMGRTEILAKYTDTATLTTKRNVKFKATQRREKSESMRKNKKEEKDKLLHDWALRQCDGPKQDVRKILEQISIKNMVEHSDKPCFIAENVVVYKDSTPESQIIFIANDNTSISTKTLVHYQMFVCNIKKATILGPKKPTEHQIEYDETKVPVDKCTRFVFEAFAPILAMFKMIQKENLYSLF
ncbi:uncharacterized protein LOC113643326 [Tachysurus fulvidraco]|uniref:uncharacterized protein LOC113643326 n=1 Tax=Tachysurus fulvidraco TaxID=1234273 RepID=UPI001FEF223C|nr:uncharacterized protein LOC113643326 [Tachysurus fulvidraco]XP_027003317.2 uncharacterized protein LOC113643326 [Tachysurus fulvidraco]